jgi:hypothetical protein
MAFSLANASSFLPFLVSGDFRNFSKFASGVHHVDGFNICDWLSHGHKADVLLVPLVFVILVVFYFSTIFIIAAIALAKSASISTTKQPFHPRYVAEKSVQDETNFFRDVGILDQISTVSSFSAMTVRGAQALALFTSGVSFVTLVLIAFRTIFIPAMGEQNHVASVLVAVGCLCFTSVGFVQTNPSKFVDGTVYRNFNVYFTGSVCTTTDKGRAFINTFHTGAVFSWAFLNIIAEYLRWHNGEMLDNTFFSPRTYFWLQLSTLLTHMTLLIVTSSAPRSLSNQVTLGLPNFVWVFITEIIAVVTITVTELMAEFWPIKYCCAFSPEHFTLAALITVVGAIFLIWYGNWLEDRCAAGSIPLDSESTKASLAKQKAIDSDKFKRM